MTARIIEFPIQNSITSDSITSVPFDTYMWCVTDHSSEGEDAYHLSIIRDLSHDDTEVLYDIFTWIVNLNDETKLVKTLTAIFSFPHIKSLSSRRKYVLVAPVFASAMSKAHINTLNWCYTAIEHIMDHPTLATVNNIFYRFTFGDAAINSPTVAQYFKQLCVFLDFGGEIYYQDLIEALQNHNIKLVYAAFKYAYQYDHKFISREQLQKMLVNAELSRFELTVMDCVFERFLPKLSN